MKCDSKLAKSIDGGDFIITAEYLPGILADDSAVTAAAQVLQSGPTAVNVADNHFGIETSSLAVSAVLAKAGVEPVYQIVTRDRNRIALQSSLLGAALLGVKNILCLSGYHQTLGVSPQSANVFDVDSIQLIAIAKQMRDYGQLLDGTAIKGDVSFAIGAAANPYTEPLELNIMRLDKKVAAGADFIQTQAVFDVEKFSQWLKAAVDAGIAEDVAILAGVMPLVSADQARELRDRYTDYVIGDDVVERLEGAGDADAQKAEGIKICVETINKIKSMSGLRGIHILSGGNETVVGQIISQVQ